MASCILIKTGGAQIEGTALPPLVLQGKTFMSSYSDKIQTGIMPYQGSYVAALGVEGIGSGVYYLIPKGYYEEDGGGSCVYAPLDNFGNATVNDVLKGKTFTSAAGFKKTGTLSPTFTKIGMWVSDNGSSYTFTADWDYAIISACYGRDGDARRGMWMSVSGCTSTDYGQSYDRISDKSCETGIITKLLINPKKGNSCSWGPGTSGSKCGVSIVGIKF